MRNERSASALAKVILLEDMNVFQVQNLVTMAPFYLPVNALLLCDLVQRLHKNTVVPQNLLAISTWWYIKIYYFLFAFLSIGWDNNVLAWKKYGFLEHCRLCFNTGCISELKSTSKYTTFYEAWNCFL